MTECNVTGRLDDENKHTHTHKFSSTKLLTRVTVADKLVLVNPSLVFHWNGGPSGGDFSVPTEHQ